MPNYLEDFKPGQVFKHWPGRTISEVDNTWFTLLTALRGEARSGRSRAAGAPRRSEA